MPTVTVRSRGAIEHRREGASRWIPKAPVLVAALAALGLMFCAFANARTRQGDSGQLIFWAGLLLILVPTSYRLVLPGASARERLMLVALLGLTLYLVKVVRDPFIFTFPDEPIHGYNANQVAIHHHLYNGNPILPVTDGYPGLASATSALMALTGMSSFLAGGILIGAARLAFVLALFVLFGRVSGSARIAGVGVLLYAANSNFVYWGAQYAYESLALPLLVAVLAAFAERQSQKTRSARAWAVPIVLGILAIVVTHHLTSYALVAILIALAVVYRLWKLPRNPWPFAVFALVLSLGWLLLVASSTVGYLSPVFFNAFNSIFNTVSGESAPRTLFHSSNAVVGATPLIPRLISLASVVLLLVGFLGGIGAVWRRRHDRPFVVLFAIASAAFFGALALRFAPAAWETGNRAGEFLFLGLAFVAAHGALRFVRPGRRLRERQLAVVAVIPMVIIGGAIAGWPWDAQLTRPLRISTSGASIESEPVGLARWLSRDLPEAKLAASEADARMILDPGNVKAKTGDALDIKTILSENRLEGWELPLLRNQHVGYVVADRRALGTDILRGYYFSGPGVEEGSKVPLAALHKFARVPLARIYDSGSIVVYDLGNRP